MSTGQCFLRVTDCVDYDTFLSRNYVNVRDTNPSNDGTDVIVICIFIAVHPGRYPRQREEVSVCHARVVAGDGHHQYW